MKLYRKNCEAVSFGELSFAALEKRYKDGDEKVRKLGKDHYQAVNDKGKVILEVFKP